MPYLTAVFAPVPLNESEPVVVYAEEYLQEVSDLISKTNKRSNTLFHFNAQVLYFVCLFILVYNYGAVKYIKLNVWDRLLKYLSWVIHDPYDPESYVML